MDDDNSCAFVFWDVNLPKILQVDNRFNRVRMAGRIDSFLRVRSSDAAIYSYLIKTAEKEAVKILFITRDNLFRESAGCRQYPKATREFVKLIILQNYRNVAPEVAAVESLLADELRYAIARILNHVLKNEFI